MLSGWIDSRFICRWIVFLQKISLAEKKNMFRGTAPVLLIDHFLEYLRIEMRIE